MAAAALLAFSACGGVTARSPSPTAAPRAELAHPDPAWAGPTMPDLRGLPAVAASERIGELRLSSHWARPVAVRCGRRPRTVAHQHPPPGAALTARNQVTVRLAALDLDRFRGPCATTVTRTGRLRPGDAAIARRFYRFAADQREGAPFAESVQVGIGGRARIALDRVAQRSLAAWTIDTTYAESFGPFSALDVLAASGGHFVLEPGVARDCARADTGAAVEWTGVRTLSLTVPRDAWTACMDWWAVTLHLDTDDQITGVDLRLGSP